MGCDVNNVGSPSTQDKRNGLPLEKNKGAAPALRDCYCGIRLCHMGHSARGETLRHPHCAGYQRHALAWRSTNVFLYSLETRSANFSGKNVTRYTYGDIVILLFDLKIHFSNVSRYRYTKASISKILSRYFCIALLSSTKSGKENKT